ncbi:MAG: tetratricopeptide repeat protein, partial [Holophagales bacterium]|nr:tetratricopeptide repeat protein [Holophagales bacterium]
GRPDEAMAGLERIREIPSADLSGEIERTEADIWLAREEFDRALDAARRALETARAQGAKRQEALALLHMAITREARHEFRQAQELAEQARALFERIRPRDPRSLGQCLEIVARVYEQDEPRVALSLFDRTIELYEQEGFIREKVVAMFGRAEVLITQGELDTAVDEIRKAQDLGQGLSFDGADGAFSANLGVSFHLRGELASARIAYETALFVFERSESTGNEAKMLTNLGEIAFDMGELERSRELHLEALAIQESLSDTGTTDYDRFRLGRVYAAMGSYGTAHEQYRHLVSDAEGLTSREGQSGLLIETGLAAAELHLVERKLHEAERWAKATSDRLARTEDLNAKARLAALEARILLREGSLDQARRVLDRVESAQLDDYRATYEVGATSALVDGTRGEVERALQSLRALAEQASKAELRLYEAECLLAIGEISLRAGRGTRALEMLRDRASAEGWGQIERRIDRLLAQPAP